MLQFHLRLNIEDFRLLLYLEIIFDNFFPETLPETFVHFYNQVATLFQGRKEFCLLHLSPERTCREDKLSKTYPLASISLGSILAEHSLQRCRCTQFESNSENKKHLHLYSSYKIFINEFLYLLVNILLQ